MNDRPRNLLFLVAELGEDRDDTTKALTVSAKDTVHAVFPFDVENPKRVVGIRTKINLAALPQ